MSIDEKTLERIAHDADFGLGTTDKQAAALVAEVRRLREEVEELNEAGAKWNAIVADYARERDAAREALRGLLPFMPRPHGDADRPACRHGYEPGDIDDSCPYDCEDAKATIALEAARRALGGEEGAGR
jgi:hypothetical protein